MTYIFITILLAALIVIGIDVYLAYTGGFNATFSWWMYTHAVMYPIIPFAVGFIFGILGGHLFWDQALNVIVQGGTSQ
jgi:hypothetical protein